MSIEAGDCKFVTKLDEKSREIARTELHELNDKDRELAVQTLRQWVLEQSWLTSPTDFEFLLRFLRARKFSQLEARKSLENYWTCKTLHPKWFLNVDPAEEGVLAMLKSGFFHSPKLYDKYGRRMLISPTERLDATLIKKYGVDTLYKAMLCVLEWIATDENAQVNGVISLFDQTNINYKLMLSFWTPTSAKDFMQFFQKAIPLRYKTMAFYNESAFFDIIMTFTRPLMTDKIQQRIKQYGSMVKLYDEWGQESFAREYLPDDYSGPCLGTTSEIIDEMVKEMLEPKFRNYIKDISSGKYKVDTKVRKHDKLDAEVASFRKLNVD